MLVLGSIFHVPKEPLTNVQFVVGQRRFLCDQLCPKYKSGFAIIICLILQFRTLCGVMMSHSALIKIRGRKRGKRAKKCDLGKQFCESEQDVRGLSCSQVAASM